MKYILMCGSTKISSETPRHLREVCGEVLIVRTIRLLKEYGVTDMAISSLDARFDVFGIPRLMHNSEGRWLNCFYPIDEPVCYVFGDVYFSPAALRTIVDTQTDSIEFFASAPPFAKEYIKPYGEPFAFKVVDTKYFFDCVERAKRYDDEHCFWRSAISWELWQVIKQTPLNIIKYDNYTVINDYTVDVDSEADALRLKRILGK